MCLLTFNLPDIKTHNMKKIYLLALAAASLYVPTAFAQPASVLLIPNVGAQVAFPSITAAYAAVPTAPTQSYTIEILPTYTGTDASEVYPIQLTDKGITPGSATTITIRPALGNVGETIQRPTPAFAPVIQFNGGDNVILDGRPGGVEISPATNLTVNQAFTTTTALPAGSLFRNIELLNSANNNTIQYINAVAATATNITGAQNIVVGGTTTTANTNNRILNNIISGGSRGIQDFGAAAVVTPPSPEVPNSGSVISNNIVRDYSGIGIFGGLQNNITISGNTLMITGVAPLGTSLEGIRNQSTTGTANITNNNISIATTSTTITSLVGIITLSGGTDNIIGNSITLSGPSATAVTGLSMSIAAGAVPNANNVFNISRNNIYGLSSGGAANIRGMSLFPNAQATLNVNNNFVSIMDANPTATAMFGMLFGLRGAGANYNSNVYYNTVRLGGTHTTGTAGSIGVAGIYRGDNNLASVFNARNNIAVNERTSATSLAAGFFNTSASGTLDIDQNNWFSSGGANTFAAGWVTSLYNDSTAYRTAATPQEQNTTFYDVEFVSNTDLHLAPPSTTDPRLKGLPIAGITTDIDNNTRPAVAPTKGADEPGGPVPVQLFAFTGVSKGDYNQLTWNTASESNNKGFEIERSADGTTFSSIGFVRSLSDNGTSATTLSYLFDDMNPLASRSYYRLKQTDRDGKFTYSNIISIKGREPLAVEITNLYPNPVKDQFSVGISSATEGKVTVIVTDAGGKNVMTLPFAIKRGDNVLPLSAAALQNGIYMLRVVNNATKETVTTQFIK